MKAFADTDILLSMVLVAICADARYSNENQFADPVDNRCVEKLVILIESEAIEHDELVRSRVSEFLPDSCSVNKTV